jgi:hypothetical protein
MQNKFIKIESKKSLENKKVKSFHMRYLIQYWIGHPWKLRDILFLLDFIQK